jgi:hypothetical protein
MLMHGTFDFSHVDALAGLLGSVIDMFQIRSFDEPPCISRIGTSFLDDSAGLDLTTSYVVYPN